MKVLYLLRSFFIFERVDKFIIRRMIIRKVFITKRINSPEKKENIFSSIIVFLSPLAPWYGQFKINRVNLFPLKINPSQCLQSVSFTNNVSRETLFVKF